MRNLKIILNPLCHSFTMAAFVVCPPTKGPKVKGVVETVGFVVVEGKDVDDGGGAVVGFGVDGGADVVVVFGFGVDVAVDGAEGSVVGGAVVAQAASFKFVLPPFFLLNSTVAAGAGLFLRFLSARSASSKTLHLGRLRFHGIFFNWYTFLSLDTDTIFALHI